MIGNVSVVSWGFLTGLAAAALVCWVGWRVLRRRRRPAGYLVLVTAVLLSSASAATVVNRHFSYLPKVRDVLGVVDGERGWARFDQVAGLDPRVAAARYPRGAVLRMPVPDRGSGFGMTRALVYLPPQYFTEPRRRFAVVYLFHGSPGVPADWFHGGAAGEVGRRLAAAGEPVILVAPRMSAGWLDDPECVDGLTEKVQTHFLRDVVPAVDGTLRTARVRGARAVVGMSAGGYCALNLGLRQRSLVATIVDMSGDTHPTHDGGLGALFGTGPRADAAVRANSPDLYAHRLPRRPVVRIWLDCGRGDPTVLGELRALDRTLRADGVDTRMVTRAGGHTFGVWRPALADSLAWAAPGLVAAAAPGPSSR